MEAILLLVASLMQPLPSETCAVAIDQEAMTVYAVCKNPSTLQWRRLTIRDGVPTMTVKTSS